MQIGHMIDTFVVRTVQDSPQDITKTCTCVYCTCTTVHVRVQLWISSYEDILYFRKYFRTKVLSYFRTFVLPYERRYEGRYLLRVHVLYFHTVEYLHSKVQYDTFDIRK